MKKYLKFIMVGVCSTFMLGANLSQCGGGLKVADFEQVNISGFEPGDPDRNDYAYSMEYFRADDADAGYVYVGTGNNMGGLIGYYIQTLMNGGDILDAPVYPPEILRYRPDLGEKSWETVLDYRDIETEGEFKTIGFRFMKTFQAADSDKDGVRSSYLYAATQGEQSVLWRSKTGDPGSWEQVFTYEELGGSIRWAEQLDDRIYLAVAYDSFGTQPPPGEIWVSTDGIAFEPITQDGFGDPNNRGIQALIAYQGWIYAGTKNDVDGFQIWKFRPSDVEPDEYDFVKVVENGGPSSHNENAGMPIVFQNKLYFGTQLYVGGVNPTSGNAFQGCDIIRINEDDSWDTIIGPGSLSGIGSGFNHFTNAYLWWMEEHDGWLYASTFDQGTLLSSLLDDLEDVIGFLQRSENKTAQEAVLALLDRYVSIDDYYRMTHAGGDIYKSPDGVNWLPVTQDGLGNPRNYGWRTMVSAPDGYLYIGSTNPSDGAQIWRATNAKR